MAGGVCWLSIHMRGGQSQLTTAATAIAQCWELPSSNSNRGESKSCRRYCYVGLLLFLMLAVVAVVCYLLLLLLLMLLLYRTIFTMHVLTI